MTKPTTYMGKPCKHGHDGERFIANRHCVTCQKLSKRNPELTYMGNPCKRYNHNGERYISNGHCVICHKMRNLQKNRTYQGRPCKLGHGGLRYSSNRSCVECDKLANKSHLDYHVAYQKARRKRIGRTDEEKAKDIARAKRWRLANPNYRGPNIDKSEARRQAINYTTIALLYYEYEGDQIAKRRNSTGQLPDDHLDYSDI